MATSGSSKSSGATTCVRAAPDAGFKACCMKSGAYDGANRNHYFQGVRRTGAAHGSVSSSIRGGVTPKSLKRSQRGRTRIQMMWSHVSRSRPSGHTAK